MDTKTNKILSLHNIPKDKSYEDFVAAQLNAAGYYLERNVVLRDKAEVLELDIVSNKFDAKKVDKTILEVKSGGWGFPEIFKVKGWMDFLNFPKASFIVQKENDTMNKYEEVSNQLSVQLVVTPEKDGKLDTSDICKVYNIKKHQKNDPIVSSLRFAFAIERRFVEIIQTTTKSVKDKKGYAILKNYLFDINSNSFFLTDSKARVESVFKAYTENKNITAKIDHERKGENFDNISDEVSITSDTFESLFYQCNATPILYSSLYVEWLQRLSMLKCCVEEMQKPQGSRLFDFSNLPPKLEERMDELKKHKYYYLYPYFWQLFVFLFGGFILKDKKDEEYTLLSELTDIPKDEIPNALTAFDILFPMESGKSWIFEGEQSNIKVLHLFSTPLCGIGANFRRLIYTDNGKYPDLKEILSGAHTYDDLLKWNQLGFEILQKSSDVVQSEQNICGTE